MVLPRVSEDKGPNWQGCPFINFVELRKSEVRRITLLGTSVNKGKKEGKGRGC